MHPSQLSVDSHSGLLSTCPNCLGSRHQNSRDSPYMPEPSGIIPTGQPHLAAALPRCSPSPTHTHTDTWPESPVSSCLLTGLGASRAVFSPGNHEYNTANSWFLSLDLHLASSHLTQGIMIKTVKHPLCSGQQQLKELVSPTGCPFPGTHHSPPLGSGQGDVAFWELANCSLSDEEMTSLLFPFYHNSAVCPIHW